MRPAREIPHAFVELDEELGAPMPLVERLIATFGGDKPLEGFRLLLVQHQLAGQVAMVDGLLRLGADPNAITWLDIPYTSHAEVRRHLSEKHRIPAESFRTCDDYHVLADYAPYQHRRTVRTVLELGETEGAPLLVLDDGAYVLKALTALHPEDWPSPLAIVEQTTRGIIKIEASAALRAALEHVPLVDVARSAPKRDLEPPFIAMAACTSLERGIRRRIGARRLRNALVLGYGAIGEQVATYLAAQFRLEKSEVRIHDPDVERRRLAERRGFRAWDPSDLSQRIDLVVGCSGRASFSLGDRAYLADGAVLASASSGAVELSRRDFIELADASDLDAIAVDRSGLDGRDLHADVEIQLVERKATFLNAGFPVNFDERLTTVPSRYIQATMAMMLCAAVQASEALRGEATGFLELDHDRCDWIHANFRQLLGDDAHYLDPPPDEAW